MSAKPHVDLDSAEIASILGHSEEPGFRGVHLESVQGIQRQKAVNVIRRQQQKAVPLISKQPLLTDSSAEAVVESILSTPPSAQQLLETRDKLLGC